MTMKRVSLFLLLLLCLSACGQTEPSGHTVEHVMLTEDERRIAVLTSDLAEKFVFEKGRVYDIKIHFYQDGEMETIGGVYGIDTAEGDEIIVISGRRDGNVSLAWSISAQGVGKYPAFEIDDDRVFVMAQGVGQGGVVMEEGKEYALVFVTYLEEGYETGVMESFYAWDTIEDTTQALKEICYAYVVTVSLSDSH